MSLSKDEVLELVKGFPETIDVEELIYRLYLHEKLAAAELDVKQGRTLSAEEARARAEQWRK